MKNWKAIASVLVIFTLGVVCGGAVTQMMHRSRVESFGGGSPAAREEQLIKRLTSQLDLDSRQQELIRPIVHETHASIRQIRQQSRPQIEQLLEESQRRISALLRPEQQEKFGKIIAERRQHRSAHGGH